jgi:hypothetical protein
VNDAHGELVALVTGAASGIGDSGRGRPERRRAAPASARSYAVGAKLVVRGGVEPLTFRFQVSFRQFPGRVPEKRGKLTGVYSTSLHMAGKA